MNLDTYCYSDTAVKKNIENVPDDVVKQKCLLFLKYAVEPLENLFHGHVVVIHSGFRCKELNTLLKGKATSQHIQGNAIDFHVQGMSLPDTYTKIKNSKNSGLVFDQLLLEGRAGGQWIHMSYNTGKEASEQRKQALELPNC